MADLFISYARDDRIRMENLAEALEAQGYSVWWDRNISGGAEFSQLIEAELMSATIVIVAWTSSSVASHWVRDEAEYARAEGKLLPISLDGTSPPLGFRQLHALDFSQWDGTAEDAVFKQLLASLGPASGLQADSIESPKSSRRTEGRQQDHRQSNTSASASSNSLRQNSVPAEAQQVGIKQATGEPATGERAGLGVQSDARPGIAILPLVNMSTDAELEHLADGLSEDMLTALSGNCHLSVAARTSSFAFKGKSTDIREVGRLLNSRYVVEGSIRKMDLQCRVTVQLIESDNGAHIWAKKFDLPLDDLLSYSDDILDRIVGNLFTQLYAAEAERATHAPPETLGAWEYSQRAAISIGRGAGSLAGWQRVIVDLDRALALAPDYPLANALTAWACNAALLNGLYEDSEYEALVEKAKGHFARARELVQDDLLILTYIAATENFAGLQERAMFHINHVLERNPASAEAWYIACMINNYMGNYEAALEAIERAGELAPEKGYSHYFDWVRGQVYLVKGDYEVAAAHLERKVRDEPAYGYANVVAGLCAYFTDDEQLARRYFAQAREHNPQLNPAKLRAIFFGQPDRDKAAREYSVVENLWRGLEAGGSDTMATEAVAIEQTDSARPGVAIMPFSLRANDPDMEFLADGLTEDIITALSANRHIRVTARAATIGYRDRSADVREIGRDLAVRYVVEGSIRKLGPRLRIGVQFIEADSGSTIWAKNFDAVADTVYDDYDEFVARIAGSLFAQLTSAETVRAQRLPEDKLGVWEYCMRSALASGQQTAVDFEGFKKNIGYLEKALELAPESSLAHAMLSWACNALLVNGMFSNAEFKPLLEKAKKHLRLAKSLAQDDLYSMMWIGAAENYAGLQERAVETLEAVLQRNPSSAEALLSIGQAYAYLGRYDDARQSIRRAMAIAPEAGMSNIQPWYLALVEHLAGNYETALPLVKQEIMQYPAYGYANVIAAIELVLLGKPEEAPKYIARAKQHNPHLDPQKLALMMLSQPDSEKGKRELEVLNGLWVS